MNKVELKLVGLDQPLRWRQPRGIFPCSMTDLFGEFVPDEMTRSIIEVMDKATWHRFAPLTKRVRRMVDFVIDWYYSAAPLHIWYGFSAGDQKSLDEARPHIERLRHLFGNDITIWVSNEPALGPTDPTGWEWLINWWVDGGESGPKARPAHPDWFRANRDWCLAHSIPYFFKQWGEFAYGPIVEDSQFVGGAYIDSRFGQVSIFPKQPFGSAHYLEDGYGYFRVGKKRAGRELDGRTWDEFPNVD
jgi:protein gp37